VVIYFIIKITTIIQIDAVVIFFLLTPGMILFDIDD